jgi:hypothetical protein
MVVLCQMSSFSVIPQGLVTRPCGYTWREQTTFNDLGKDERSSLL